MLRFISLKKVWENGEQGMTGIIYLGRKKYRIHEGANAQDVLLIVHKDGIEKESKFTH